MIETMGNVRKMALGKTSVLAGSHWQLNRISRALSPCMKNVFSRNVNKDWTRVRRLIARLPVPVLPSERVPRVTAQNRTAYNISLSLEALSGKRLA
jgi:hypothetical protein